MDFWFCLDLTFARKCGTLNYLERKLLVVLVEIDGIASEKKKEAYNIDQKLEILEGC